MGRRLRKRLRSTAWGLSSMSAIAIGVFGVRAPIIERFAWLDAHMGWLLWGSLAALLIAAALFATSWLAPRPKPFGRIDPERARPADLKVIHDMASKLFDMPVSDLASTLSRELRWPRATHRRKSLATTA